MPPKDKKPGGDKKPEKPAGWNLDPAEAAIVLLIGLAIFSTLGPAVWRFITEGELSFFGIKFSTIYDFFADNIQFFKALGFIVAGFAALGTFIFTKKGDAIWRA